MSKKWTDLEKLKIEHAQRYVDYIDGLDKTLADAEMKIEVIRNMAMPGAMRYDAINVTTSPSDDAIPNAVAALEDVSDLEYLIKQIKDERAQFCLMLRYELTSVGATFMYTHYKYGIDYKTIADSADIDVTTERDRRKEALIEMYDKGFVPLEYQIQVPSAI